MFHDELDHWKIPFESFSEEITPKISQEFDQKWCASTLFLESSGTVVKKHNAMHGIVFCKYPLDTVNNAVEFKSTMNIQSRSKSHIFIGVIDKTKYKYEHLISTCWKDSPVSYYWDVWNTKLIKTDENGIQVGSISGYGCPCEEFETRIIIYYDRKTRSISFYKNGINQGVAFKNVPIGMTPSIDLWFESGSIKL